MSFPRYPKYKASGVEWLGQVPEHWDVAPAKWHLRSASGGNSIKGRCANEPAEGLYPAFSASGQDVWLENYDFNVPGIVLSAVGARCGKTFKADGAWGVVANTHCLFPIQDSGRDYFWYLTNQGDWWEKGGSAQPFVKVSDTLARKWVFPPLTEQTAIAEFLDRETAKIDGLVAEQRRLMELLKEKRQAVISHAVTKGLNPQAALKPSGIEWLGDVPAHWSVGKLGYASKLRGGFAFSAADFGTEGIVVIRMNNLKRGHLDLSEAARIPECSCNQGAALSEGDLIWGMSGSTGETGSLGNYARVHGEDLPCQLNQRVGRFAADSSLLNLDFLEQVIQTPYFYEQVMLLVTGTAQFNVSSEQVQSCLVALPPVSEQVEIAAYVAREAGAFDTLTAEAQRAIDLLQERRTALISAAVTGQIDVRPRSDGINWLEPTI